MDVTDFQNSNEVRELQDNHPKRKGTEDIYKTTVKTKRINARGAVRPRRYNVNTDAKFSNIASTSHEKLVDETVEEASIDEGGICMSNSEVEDICDDHSATSTVTDDTLDHSATSAVIQQLLDDARLHHVLDSESEDVCGDWIFPEEKEFVNDDEDGDNDDDDDEENRGIPEKTSNKFSPEEPIYEGHTMTIQVSMLLILLYSMSHGISGSQLSDLLTIIGLHCLKVHPGMKSIFHFKKYFADLKSPLVKHYFCQLCLTKVNPDVPSCPNKFCLKDLSDDKSKSYFIEIPIESQLRNMFQKTGFSDLITHRFNRIKKKLNNIEDIYDGEVYKNMSKTGGPLSSSYPYNMSFTMNTDGVPIFKSSNFSIWPVFLMINELPYKLRRLNENLIFCGLWFGDTKPLMDTFFQPLHQSFRKLEENGILVNVNGNEEICKAFLLCSTSDLPAKCLYLKMNQYNGDYSCFKCLQKGETFKTAKGGSVHIFPFKKDSPTGEKRSAEGCIKDGLSAVKSNSTVNGMKGVSFLMTLNSYELIKSSSIDYMHNVLLGITKLLLKLWISTPFSKEDFSVSVFGDIIDKRLLNIKPPSFITRVPRAVTSHLKYWKASELRSWLLFYSLPVLSDIMNEDYYTHYASFVEGIYLLMQESITLDDINRSYSLLTYFVLLFESLYGSRYQTLNLHLLLHLPETVKELGPLWVYSCFPFENANGQITKLFHGTQNVDLQIASSVNIIQLLPSLLEDIPEKYEKFVKQMNCSKPAKFCLDKHLQFLGRGYQRELSENINIMLYELLNYEQPKLKFYSRVLLRGEVIHSTDYKKVKKRNTYTVKYFCSTTNLTKFGAIQFYGQHISHNFEQKNFAFLCPFLDTSNSVVKCKDVSNKLKIKAPHIHVVKPGHFLEVIEVQNILAVCVVVNVIGNENVFICEVPNNVESD